MPRDNRKRDKRIIHDLQTGMTMSDVADRYSVTKGRVSQILKDANVEVNGALIRKKKYADQLVQKKLNLYDRMLRVSDWSKIHGAGHYEVGSV